MNKVKVVRYSGYFMCLLSIISIILVLLEIISFDTGLNSAVQAALTGALMLTGAKNLVLEQKLRRGQKK